MKFPYELSELRRTLLSKEDQEIYEFEHSIYYSATLKEMAMQSRKDFNNMLYESLNEFMLQINDDSDYDNMPAEEKRELAKALSRHEAKQLANNILDLFGDFIVEDDGLTEEEANTFRNYVVESIFQQSLYDAEQKNKKLLEDELGEELDENEDVLRHGEKDMWYWLPGFSWVGTLLGAALGGLVALLKAGKDAIAARLLIRYMNKIVEKIDNGQNRRQTIFSLFGSKNSGGQEEGCLRSIQENVERNRYTMSLVWAKSAGLIDDPKDALYGDAESGGYAEAFDANIGSKLKLLSRQDDK